MNIQIRPEMMKWKDVIDKYMGGPMFFIFDDQLVNMYQYLSRLSDEELKGVCKDAKFAKMCDTVIGERKSDYGELSGFVNERGMLNIEGLLPILSSFPSFNDAMNFIMRIKPGFRYTPQFKDFVEKNIQVEKVDDGILNITTYTLGDYQYIMKEGEDDYVVEYRKLIKGEWELHRINGPAYINLFDRLILEWYREGALYVVDDKYTNVVYHSAETTFEYVDYNSENVENIVELPYNITKNNSANDDSTTIYYYNDDYNFAYTVRNNNIKSRTEKVRNRRNDRIETTEKYIHDPTFDRFRLVELYTLKGHDETQVKYNVNGQIAYVEKNSTKAPFKTTIVYYNPDGSIRE